MHVAVLFPGQGSQYVGMAGAFLDRYGWAREIFAQAEEASGLPIGRLCLEGPLAELTRTLHLQPAITAVNLVCWRALQEAGVKVDVVAGHSLGEYAALAAAGVFSIEDCLRLVSERGRLMEREGAAHPGAMSAILGLDIAAVEAICGQVTDGVVTVANHNTPVQVVISGDKAAVAAAGRLAKEAGGKAIPLRVSGPWHSPLVAGAIEDFSAFMADIPFTAPRLPCAANVSGRLESEPAVIRDLLARQIAARVRWVEIVEDLWQRGVRTFIEAGPKTVLSGLVKKIVPAEPEVRILHVEEPDQVAAVLD